MRKKQEMEEKERHKSIRSIEIQGLHQLRERPVLAFLQSLVTALADPQGAEHTAMPDLAVEIVAGHARQRAPYILRDGHCAVLLEAREVDSVQRRRDGRELWGCEGSRRLITRHCFQRVLVLGRLGLRGWDEVFEGCPVLPLFSSCRRGECIGEALGLGW